MMMTIFHLMNYAMCQYFAYFCFKLMSFTIAECFCVSYSVRDSYFLSNLIIVKVKTGVMRNILMVTNEDTILTRTLNLNSITLIKAARISKGS
jgi:hypothetical protein